jgi:hypothetical protein
MLIAPALFIHYLNEDSTPIDSKRHLLLYLSYLAGLLILNMMYITLSTNYYFSNYNWGFSDRVPEGLAKNARIDEMKNRLFYFNFGLLMTIGKFLSFTYLPFGMSKYVHNMIFLEPIRQEIISISEDEVILLNEDNSEETTNFFSDKIKNKSSSGPSLEIREKSEISQNYSIKETKVEINIYAKIFKNSFSSFIYISLCILMIITILISKYEILYSKLFYNICGIDCGLLAYRFDDMFTLNTITTYLYNHFHNRYIRVDFLFFCFILLFRGITVYISMKEKGIAFMWIVYKRPENDIMKYQVLQFYATILFTGMILLYDFTYLMPDYVRFYGLEESCDYTLISKANCGVSFYGLLFVKISMNFHFFMFFDIFASMLFIMTSVLWIFRLIINPMLKSRQTNDEQNEKITDI